MSSARTIRSSSGSVSTLQESETSATPTGRRSQLPTRSQSALASRAAQRFATPIRPASYEAALPSCNVEVFRSLRFPSQHGKPAGELTRLGRRSGQLEFCVDAWRCLLKVN
jgi:hypothetical protein